MATCLDGDSFYLDASVYYDDISTFDGCYVDSGDTHGDDDLILYSRGGYYYEDEPAVIATTNDGTATWGLVIHDAADSLFHFRCIDADGNDATLIHPTEVTQWICVDEDLEYLTILDAVTTSCGCPTPTPTPTPTPAPTYGIISPAPTPAPKSTPVPLTPTPTPLTPAATVAPSTPTPETFAPVSPPTPQPAGLSTCGATESFQIMSGSISDVAGCFQATDESFSNQGGTIEIWSVSGNTNFEQVAVVGFTDDSTGETSDSPYSLMYFTEEEDDRILYCQSNEDAITVHPVDATWICDMSGTGSFTNVTDADISFDCGCITTPSPSLMESSSSAPPPTSTPASVPLWAVISGAVGGAAFLVIVGLCVGRHRREKKRNENSRPPGGSNYPMVSQGVGGAGALAGSGSAPVPYPPPPASTGLPSGMANLAPVAGDKSQPPQYSDPPAYSG